MAKKLPPEELDKIKAGDLAIYLPQKPTDPGQTELFGTQKVKKKKTAKPKEDAGAGRPRKHAETYSTTSFRLSPETLRRLRVRAALDGVSAADVITRLAAEMHVPGIDK